MTLSGNEILFVTGIQSNGQLSPITEQTTTGAIAALGSSESSFTNTAITTVGNGTLTAAGLVGGQITRTGPTGNFSDTTDTAANITAALPSGAQAVLARIKNATAFTQTITAGSGVTLPPTVIIPPFSVGNYEITVQSATAVTLIHLSTVPIAIGANSTVPAITTISTVGNGTLTAASFVGGLISRGGSQSGTAFTDTTDTATAIVAACANLVNKVGTSMLIEYANTTNATATITGGTGVTASGVTVIPPNTIAQFLFTYTAATPTATLVGLGVTQNVATAVNILGSSTGSTKLQSGLSSTSNNTLTLPITASDTLAGLGTAQTFTAAQTFTNSDLLLLGSSTGATTFTSANAGASNFTVTVPAITANMAITGAPIAVGSSTTATAAQAGLTFKLDTVGGSTLTLPAATGTGNTYYVVVTATTTGGAHKVLAASGSDFMNGIVTGENANTAKCFASAASTNHSLQMPFAGSQPSGGFIGDWFTLTDVATNLWTVRGMYQAGTTPTTPFSSATS